jgi:hypothetical protein
MFKPTFEELKVILDLHVKWRQGDPEGSRANLSDADLSGANLSDANLSDADLRSAGLSGANLSGASLDGANLRRADLSCAELNGVNLNGANLHGVNLNGADLSGASLGHASLRGADLSGATIARGVKCVSLDRRATRGDGHEFFLWRTNAGWRVLVSCRFFTMDEAWQHWEVTRGNTPLGDESLDILTMFELHIQRVQAGK